MQEAAAEEPYEEIPVEEVTSAATFKKPFERRERSFERKNKPFDRERKPFDRERKPFGKNRKFDRYDEED